MTNMHGGRMHIGKDKKDNRKWKNVESMKIFGKGGS